METTKASSSCLLNEIASSSKLGSLWVSSCRLLSAVYVHAAVAVLGIGGIVAVRSILDNKEKSIAQYVLWLMQLFMPLTGLMNCYSSLRKRYKLFEIQYTVCVVYKRIPGVNPKCDVPRYILIDIFVLFICIVCTFCATTPRSSIGKFLNCANWYIFFLYILISNASFRLVVNQVELCFKKMHICISHACPETAHNLLPQLAIDYDLLVEICKRIDDYFCPQNLVLVAFSFGTLVGQTYCLVGSNIWWRGKLDWLIHVGFVGLVCSVPLSLIATSTAIEQKAEEFNDIFSSFVIRDRSGRNVSNQYVIAHFLIAKKVKFISGGLLTLNRSLAYSVIAASVTFLMVLVQFGKPYWTE